jgi:hypothetical protein
MQSLKYSNKKIRIKLNVKLNEIKARHSTNTQ